MPLRLLAVAAAAVAYAGVAAAPGWAAAPDVTLTSPSDGAFVSGSTDFAASAQDTGTGVGVVQFEVATTPSGPYTIFATAMGPGGDNDWHGVWSSRPADGTYWVRAEAFDTTSPNPAFAATDPIQVTLDDSSPSLSVTCTPQNGDGSPGPCGWYQPGDAGIEVCASADDGSGSGVATFAYTDDGSDPLSSAGQPYISCFGSYSADTTVRVGAVDALGNANEVTAQIRFDDTAPLPPKLALGPASDGAYLVQTAADAYTVWYRYATVGAAQLDVDPGGDPKSGVTSATFQTVVPDGWSIGAVDNLTATYHWPASGAIPNAPFDVTATNGAGLTGDPAHVDFVNDTFGPTGTAVCVPASCSNPNGPVRVTDQASDTGSGIAEIRYTTDGTDPSPTHGTVGSSVVVTSASTVVKFWAVDHVGNAVPGPSTDVGQASPGPSPTITASLDRDDVFLSGFLPSTPITLTVGGQDVAGVTTDGNGQADVPRSQHGQDLVPGMVVTADDGLTSDTLTLAPLHISSVDTDTDTVSGTSGGLKPFTLTVTRLEVVGTAQVSPEANGDWTVQLPFDVQPGDGVFADLVDVDGNVTRAEYLPPAAATPVVGASITDGWVELDGWMPGSSVSLTIDEQPSGTVIVDGQGHALVQSPPNADRLQPGVDVVATDGVRTATLALADVGFDGLDLGTGSATGHAPPGSTVHVELNPPNGAPVGGQDVLAPNGTWSADFGAELPLSPPLAGTATLFDGSGDFTAASIHVAAAPHVDASITNDWIDLEGWTPNTTASVTIDDGDTFDVAIDANGHGSLDGATSGHDLVSGTILDVSDGAQATSLTLADPASFDSIDVFKNVASGTAPFGSPVSVCVGGQAPGCVDASVQDNDTWTADLAPLAPIAPGTHATASIDDGNGNHTVVERDAAGGALVVTNTGDSGPGSLRQAILDANGRSGADTITFDIPGTGTQTISPQTPLPAITDPVTIDGYTQPGAQPSTTPVGQTPDGVLEIVLDGSSIAPGAAATAGLDVQAAGTTIRGLVIGGGFSYGIWLDGAGATGDTVVGNYLGTNADGTQTRGLNQFGVFVSDGAANDVVGTPDPADRNVLSGTTGISPGGGAGLAIARGAHDTAVVGNLIGTTADGRSPLPNGTGVLIESGAHDNRIGDGDRADANVVSENSGAGVAIQDAGTDGNVVSGNWLGITWVDVGSTTDSGNGGDGVRVTGGASATISTNTIENNGGDGVATQLAGPVTISANGIHSNGGLGIDVGSDGVTPNDPRPDTDGVQNFPVITDVGADGTVSGTLDSAPDQTYRVDLFTNAACDPSGYGEGQGFRDSTTVTTDGNGHATFTAPITLDAQATGVTATATDAGGRTSEFSQCFALTTTPSTLTVDTADDHDDGSCSVLDCSLREAIAAANAHPGPDTIVFAIGVGPQTIHLTSALPPITDAVTIDGTSQPGWLAAPIVTLDGSGIESGGLVDGLLVQAPNTTVRGLVVDGFSGIGIHVLDVDDAVVAGNYLGVDASGAATAGNGGDGVRIEFGSGATVGGPSALDRNVVGGNGLGALGGHGIFLDGATSSVVRGNYSGTNADGSSALANSLDGIAVDGGTGNTIVGNLASGNDHQGISLFGVFNAPPTGTTIRGNLVGTDASGTGTIANGGDGILVAASQTVVGGILAGQGNVVRGNGAAGVAVTLAGAVGDTISGNSIDDNGGLGIDLAAGANDGQAAPAIATVDATGVSGTLAGAPGAQYRIEVFQSPSCDPSGGGEGRTFVASAVATADGNGAVSWTAPGGVDPSTTITATATALASGDTSAFSQCSSLGSLDLHATLTVDQPTSPVGASQFPLDSLPPQLFTQLATGDPASAPIPTAPIPTAAVGAAPIPTAPIPTAPIPTAPIPTAPIPTAPIPTAPIPTAPIPTAGLGGLPIPTASTAPNPLDSILLSSLPGIDPAALFDGTPLAGRLPQQYTLGDVYRTPVALDRFNHLTVAEVPLSQTLLRGVRTLSYLLGGKTLDHIRLPGGEDWCTALTAAGGSCANVDPATTTVIGLDIMGQLGSLDLGRLTVGDLVGGLDGTLVGEAYLARIAFQETTIANIPATPQFVTCSACATLGDAAAAKAVRDEVPLKDLGSAADGVTLNELVVALSPRNALPWEEESFLGWQGFGGQAQQLQYHLDLDVPCPVTTALTLRVKLPYGFVYVPGSTVFTIGTGAPAPGDDPALDPKTGATWKAPSLGACTEGQTQHVRLDFQGEAGFQIGPTLATATIGVNGGASQVSGAPVVVQRAWTDATDRSTAPTIQPDTIVLSHIDHAGGTNYFRLPELGRGKQVTIYLKPPAGVDYDLYVVRPAPDSLLASPIPTAPIPTAPIPTAPIPTAPIPTADTSVTTTTDNPAPELSDDGPLPGGEVAVDSITRGDGVEVVSFRQAGTTGYDEIAVAGYNGAFSNQPFELRARVDDPAQLPPNCPARTFLGGDPVQAGQLPTGPLPSDTQALALVNVGRMNAMYGAGPTAAMLAKLEAVMNTVHGQVLQIDGDNGVFQAAAAWDASPCSIDAANAYVHAINVLVASYRGNLTDLRSITLVGDDEQIPFARVPDFVPINSEFDNTGPLAYLTQNGTVDNATYAAAGLGYVLTDDAYGAFHTRTLFGHEFFLPEVALGRLVETPDEITGQLQRFLDANGTLDPTTGFVSGYEFMSDGAKAVDDGLAQRIGPAPSATNTLLRDTWSKTAISPFLTGAAQPAGIDSWNAHYDAYRLMPAVYSGPSDLLSTGLLPSPVTVPLFANRILFTMGCHAGESIADTFSVAPLDLVKQRDWAQAFAQEGAAVFVANTGYGYGDTATVALSERLMTLFAGHLGFNGSVGEKFLQTKADYFSSMGAYGPYDEKAIEEATFYGLPFWQVNSPTEPTPTPPGPLSPDGSLQTAPLTITPSLTRVNDARGTFWKGGAGTVFVPGRSVQPLETREVTQDASTGLVAHGFFPSSLVTDDSNKNLDLYFAKPMIDLGAHEPEPSVTNDVFPASPVKVAQADYLGRRHSTVELIAGQSRPGASPSRQNERLITSIGGVVTYAPASETDYTPPTFHQTGAFVSGGQATIFATVSDGASAVIRVRAFYTTGGPWTFVDLQPVAGVPGAWRATVAVGVPKIEIGTVAEDAAGNTGWMTGKGILVESFTPSSPPPPAGITIDRPFDGGTFTLGQSVPASYSCTATTGIASCSGTVADGSPVDTTTIGPHTFSVTATDLLGQATTATASYTVVYDFDGSRPFKVFPQPVPAIAGLPYPLFFTLHGRFGLKILADGYPQSFQIPCSGPVDDGSGTQTSTPYHVGLVYIPLLRTYVYVWKTQRAWAGTCREFVLKLDDGSIERAAFAFRR